MDIHYFDKCVTCALSQRKVVAKTLEDAGYRVYQRYDFNPQAIFSAVGKGGIVMPIISGRFFTPEVEGLVYTLILQVNRAKQIITLYNPIASLSQEYPLTQFVDQWVIDGSDCLTAFKMDEQTYHPHPADLSEIQLPDHLQLLCEEMAENAHDVWAMERQSEGWTYGPKRDDHQLQTPDMVPYSQLLETEKQYDRLMAMETLKLIMKLGFIITP